MGVRAFTLENIIAAPVAASAHALPPSPAGTAQHARTHTLKTVGGVPQMGAPFAPPSMHRARLTKMPRAAPTGPEIVAAGGLQQWEVRQGLLEKISETIEGQNNQGFTKLVDMPLAQSQSHIQFKGNEGDVAVAAEGALVYNDGIWDAITVECWVKDMKIGEHSGYVSAFNSDPAFGAKHFGFMLGTYKSQFAFGIGAGDNTEMDYVMAPDWLTMPNEGKWTHLAGTFSLSHARTYTLSLSHTHTHTKTHTHTHKRTHALFLSHALSLARAHSIALSLSLRALSLLLSYSSGFSLALFRSHVY